MAVFRICSYPPVQLCQAVPDKLVGWLSFLVAQSPRFSNSIADNWLLVRLVKHRLLCRINMPKRGLTRQPAASVCQFVFAAGWRLLMQFTTSEALRKACSR